VADLAKLGYECNFGIAPDESLLSLASGPFQSLLKQCPKPQAAVFHHSYAASASLPIIDAKNVGFMSHAQYFPAALLRTLDLDHIPYLASFSTGCVGFFTLILTAAGLCVFSRPDPVICMTADIKPAGTTYDTQREKILSSDCCSGFLIGYDQGGYQVLGISYYSTERSVLSLVEVVKRAVQMLQDLTHALMIDYSKNDIVFHFPNIFPGAWQMVIDRLLFANNRPALDDLAKRAHCLSSDPIITLAKWHRGQTGRLHFVVNFGSGLHLAVGIFKEGPALGCSA
jgi:hypothetical protein